MTDLVETELKLIYCSGYCDKDHLKRLQKEYAGFALVKKLIEYENKLIDIENEAERRKLIARYNLNAMEDIR